MIIAGIVVALQSGGSPATHSIAPPVAIGRCPLTDLPAPGGKVPRRPAVAVKIGNEPIGARPQSGLNEADIVYDTPAEGFIMRYMAVYQCSTASSIGPTRSVRWVDWNLLAPFQRTILAFAGGINPDVATASSLAWIAPADLLAGAQSAGVRTTNRVPPDNLYTGTGALWALYPKLTTPPPPVFAYSAATPPGATPASELAINFSQGTDVAWKWDGATGQFVHSYSGVTDVDALTGQPVSTTNIVVQIVHFSYGPYAESPGGPGDVQSQMTGSGPGYVLRGGKAVKVTWHRAGLSDVTTFTNSSGGAVALAPGRTWVEIVLDVVAAQKGAITITP